ncbi:MAG: PepSY domain-containing protein [Pseudomonadota bacterium]
MIRRFALSPLIVSLALLGLVATAGPAAANCLSGGQARAAVQSGEAAPLRAVAGGVGGEVVKAQLCRQGGRLVYVVGVLQRNGQVVRRVIDARTGQVLR